MRIKAIIYLIMLTNCIAKSQDTLKEHWDNDNVKRIKVNDTNGDGIEKFFYENGKLRYNGFISKFKKTGTWTFYKDNGKLLKTENYKNDLLDSLAIHYFPNGKIEEIRTYKNDTLNGFSFVFYNIGQLMIFNYNLKGESVYSETYYKSINKINSIKNQLPKDISIIKNYYPNGNLKKINFFVNNTSLVIHFDINGILIKGPLVNDN